MSQYSETIGSFIRTGNYPLEANYIFADESSLKKFYTDPINATTIHKGLLKIVENDGNGNQALYWVTKKKTNDELEFTKLIGGSGSVDDQIKALSDQLTEEIKNRKDNDTAIWGTTDPTNIPQDLNSILDLANEVERLKKEVDNDSFVASLKALAGTTQDDIVAYLKTLSYKSLTEVSTALNKFLNTTDSSSTQINTLPELQAFLKGYNDSQTLYDVLTEFKTEILGSPAPSKQFETLKAIEDFVRILKSDTESKEENLQLEINTTQSGVGLDSDGSYSPDQETNYLKDATSVMNALKTLDYQVYKALQGVTLTVSNNDVVALNVRKELDSSIISAKLNLSNTIGNHLVKKDDGLYFNVKSTYQNGVLSLYVNENLVAQHILGFSSIVESAYYDSTTESIIVVFKLLSGEKQTITIPVGNLIREWDVDNSGSTDTIVLSKKQVLSGPDLLSADVRIYSDAHNILKKNGNALVVDGTSDSITYNNKSLTNVIDGLNTTISDNNTTLTSKITAEIDRAKTQENSITESLQKKVTTLTNKDTELQSSIDALEIEVNTKADIDSPIFTGVPQVKVSPDATDASQRIPSTNWVIARIKESTSKASITREEVEQLLALKADLVDGVVPLSQLPVNNWIDVE